MTEEIKGSERGWLRRIFRAVIIGLIIYFMLSLSVSSVINKSRKNSGQSGVEQKVKDLNLPLGQLPPNEADLAVNKGYAWASEHDVRDHAVCRGQWTNSHDSLVRSGCSKYVTEQNVLKVVKPIPQHAGWDDGTTTAECMAEVHAYWDPVVADMRAQGDEHVAQSRMSRTVVPALEECKNYDNIRIGRVIHEPQMRIDEILKKARNGGAITPEDMQTVRNDYPGVFSFPEDIYRTRYLNSAEEFFRLAGGRDQVLPEVDKKFGTQ